MERRETLSSILRRSTGGPICSRTSSITRGTASTGCRQACIRRTCRLPYDDSLLWVYEGMTQYYGNVMSWRDGIRRGDTYPDHVAATYAYYDNQPGRRWRSLGDTATSAPIVYSAPRGYGAERRGEDFYAEAS